MKKIKILSAFLALVMLCGMLTTGVSAAWADKVNEDGDPLINYLTKQYYTPEEKLADMIMVKEEGGYQIWYEEFTGEIAFVDMATGQTYFSNPFDIGTTTASQSVKQQLLSQVIISFKENGISKTFASYTEAALRGQIKLKNIKNGIRVEYIIGEEQTTRLVPRMIEKSRFEDLILANIDNEWDLNKITSYYSEMNPFAANVTDRALLQMQAKYPVTMDMAIYVCLETINARELRLCEEIVKKYAPGYTYEMMEEDHDMTGYTGDDAAPPRFRIPLEYTIVDGGFEVRLPANAIDFDESNYQFETVQILPYFCAGNNAYTGYTMIPDGSGALIRFEDLIGKVYNVSGQMYGSDYAYHEISGQHSEVMRMPTWGVVTNYGEAIDKETGTIGPRGDIVLSKPVMDENGVAVKVTDDDGNEVIQMQEIILEPIRYTNGYLAYITEGDSLATLMSHHGGTQHPYNTVYPLFTPRPSDEYNLADSISVAGSATWTITSKRKYTESYRIRYFLLSDAEVAKENKVKDYYDASYMGMAEALRGYLTETGALTKLENVNENIPMYIESFGSITTRERVLSFPVEVETPLTTFADIKTMYEELTELGVGNVNFRLTGFANGSMDNYTYPTNVKWSKSVGGEEGFIDLVSYANEKGFNVYPDFDFANINYDTLMDGVSYKKDAVRTIDNRYTIRAAYDPATQSFDRNFGLCISPKSYEKFFDKFTPKYSAFGNTSISLGTLGTDLNSDFDEDDPYHREDNKQFTKELLEKAAEQYESVMIGGGNMYAVPYADIITEMALSSSHYVNASASIPFMGMVLHGSKVFTGTALNMEGDMDEMILRSIESGASPYFTLSYQNTNRMKESMMTSKYYSVNYDIWKDDVAAYYTVLNDVLKDVQDQYITDHQFLDGQRVPDEDEAAADAIAAEAEAKKQAEAEKAAAEKKQKAVALRERLNKQKDILAGKASASDIVVEEEENEAVEEEWNQEVADAYLAELVVDRYSIDPSSVVYVEYENGVAFILNYNSFDITTEVNGKTYTVNALDFIRID